MTRPHRSHLLTALHAPLALLLACTPLAKSVGDDLDGGVSPSESGDESSDEGTTGAGLDPSVPEWTEVFPSDVLITKIVTTPDGGVAAIRHRQMTRELRVIRHAADGSFAWESDLYDSQLSYQIIEVNDLVSLPNGGIVVGGATLDEGHDGTHATLWALPANGGLGIGISTAPPREGRTNASVVELAVFGDRIPYLTHHWSELEAPIVDLRFMDEGLGAPEGWNDVPGPFHDVAMLASGDIATLEPNPAQVGTDRLRTFTELGDLSSEQVVPSGAFATDVPLVRLEYLDDGSTRLVSDASDLDVILPGIPSAVAHGPGVAVVSPTAAGDGIALVQLDALGAELRAVDVPAPDGGTVTPLDVAISPDGSVYIAGHEQEPTRDDGAGPVHGFIVKLPPP